MNAEIKIGFLRGIGFSVAFVFLWVVVFGLIYLYEKHVTKEGWVDFDDSTKLIAETSSHKVNGSELTLLGEIRNETESNWKSIDLEAEFYLEDKFVKECSERVDSKVQSGEVENFEMGCNCCKDSFPEFDRIKLRVNNAWRY